MSAYYAHNKSNYLCVDKDPETDDGGVENQNGALLYIVEFVCGSLPCPPYTEGFEAACVVCTK